MLSTLDHSRALTLDPWTIGPGLVSTHLNGLGYFVEHEIGAGPDEVGVRLMDFDCEELVGPNEAIFLDNEVYDGSTAFSYDIYIQTTFVFNSSLVFFDETGDTGESLGEVKFCVLTTSNMTVPGEPDIEIHFRRTKYKIGFDFTENPFTTDFGLELPSATSCFDVNFTIADITADETTIIQEYNLTFTESLNRILEPYDTSVLPPGYSVSTGIFGRHDIRNFTGDIPSGEQVYFANVSTCVTFPCVSEAFCDAVNVEEMPDYFSQIFGEYENSIADDSLQLMIRTVAAEYAAGLSTGRTFDGMLNARPLPLDYEGGTEVPDVEEVLDISSSLALPALVPVDNVTYPLLDDGSFNETLVILMEDIVFQSLKFLLEPIDAEFPNVETSYVYFKSNFTGGTMYNVFNTTIDFECPTDGCEDAYAEVAALLEAILLELEIDMGNGKLRDTIDIYAAEVNVTNFANTFTSSNGLLYPTSGTAEPVLEVGAIGVTNSSRFLGNHTIFNVTEPSPSNLTDIVVTEALVVSTMDYVTSMMDLDIIFICGPQIYGTTDGVPSLQISVYYEFVYFCANSTDCAAFEDNELEDAQIGMVFTLNQTANNGVFQNQLVQQAALEGVPELQYPTDAVFEVEMQSSGRRMLEATDDTPFPDQPPIVTIGEVSGLSTSVSLPVDVAVSNVVDPVDDLVLKALMDQVVLQATQNELTNYTGTIPDGYSLTLENQNSTFSGSTMTKVITVTNTFVCESEDACDELAGGEGQEIVTNFLSELIELVDNGKLGEEIRAVAVELNCTGFEQASVDEEIGYPFVAGSNIAFDTGIEVIGGGSTSLLSFVCIENVTQVNDTFDTEPVTVVVQEAIDLTLADYASLLPDSLTFSSVATYYILQESNETGKIDVTFNYNVSFIWSYECETLDICSELSANVTELYSPPLVELVTFLMDEGEFQTNLRDLAIAQNVEPLYDATVPSECFSFPTVTIIPVGDFTGIKLSYSLFDFIVVFDYAMIACRCDLDLECINEPVAPFDLFRICVVPENPQDVEIMNLNLTVTGVENNYAHVPVVMGGPDPDSGAVVVGPFATVTDLGDVIMIETYLTAPFYIENGGSTEVSFAGNVFLSLVSDPWSSERITDDIESSEFRFNLPLVAMDIEEEEEEEDDAPTTKFYGCFQNFLRLIGLL